MVKTDSIKKTGEVIEVETEQFQRKPIQISYTQAKKLMKKEMSEKQRAHTEKLAEANRLRWEQKKAEKMKQLEEQVKKELEEKEQKKKSGQLHEVIVKPKRVYKNVIKKDVIPSKKSIETDSETESSEEEIIIKKVHKPKKKVIMVEESSDEEPPELVSKSQLKSKVKPSNDIDTKLQTIKKIDDTLKTINKYAGLVRF